MRGLQGKLLAIFFSWRFMYFKKMLGIYGQDEISVSLRWTLLLQ